MFADRRDAGRRLARALEPYRGSRPIVLAVPRGGAEVGYEVARSLGADFDLVIARKLPFPDEPESGFGAVAEDGSAFIFPRAARWVGPGTIERVAARERREIGRRIAALRGGRPLPDLRGRTVILVDDGIAMGSTMRACLMLCRRAGAERVVVAAPVAGPETAAAFAREADEVVILETPPFFRAVAQVYRRWYDLDDAEVVAIMRRWERSGREARDGREED
ncbi:MAG: phosphoribosyltransferase family protein [bacterium]|nr:phosphoribosyltransferase family protein [bacterium]